VLQPVARRAGNVINRHDRVRPEIRTRNLLNTKQSNRVVKPAVTFKTFVMIKAVTITTNQYRGIMFD
jgi:hypothetical protein